MIEAEFHAVWLSPYGLMTDITPVDEKRILFLPDKTRVYDGQSINNIRKPLSDDPLIHEFVEVNNQISELIINSKLIGSGNLASVNLNEMATLWKKQEKLGTKIAKTHLSPDEPCFCGSDKKFKYCHRNK